jgi:hypothetical protein
VFWSAEVDTSAVLLTQVPDLLPAAGNLSSRLDDTPEYSDDQGVHSMVESGASPIRLIRLPGVEAETTLAAVVPLDADGFDRIDAIERLLRALLARSVARDTRLTPQQKLRQRQMLQATDGRMNGASIREIAAVLFGVERVAAEHWPTSTLRVTTSVLVSDGMAMIAGGYRSLLRHRRQP